MGKSEDAKAVGEKEAITNSPHIYLFIYLTN